MSEIQRYPATIASHAIPTVANIAQAKPIEFGNFSDGAIEIASGGGTTLSFYGTTVKNGTVVPIYDHENNQVQRTVASGRGYQFPPECFGFVQLYIVADAALVANISLKA